MKALLHLKFRTQHAARWSHFSLPFLYQFITCKTHNRHKSRAHRVLNVRVFSSQVPLPRPRGTNLAPRSKTTHYGSPGRIFLINHRLAARTWESREQRTATPAGLTRRQLPCRSLPLIASRMQQIAYMSLRETAFSSSFNHSTLNIHCI